MAIARALAAFLLFAPGAALAGDPAGGGTTGASFLKVGVGPKAVGMGQNFVGLADDVNAIYYNPAGLGALRRQELTLMHTELFSDVRQEWLAYAFPTETLGTFAMSVDVQHVRPFDAFDANNVPSSQISAQDAAYELAYARRVGDTPFLVGGGVKLIKSRLNDAYAVGVAFDAGVLYETPVEGLKAGASAVNMGAPMHFISENFNLPLAGKAGLSYKIQALQDTGNEFSLVSDMTVYRDRNAYAGAGLEYLRQGALALRAGWTGVQDASYGFTLGAGVDVNRLTKGRLPEITFDYAFESFGDLSQSHRASMTFRFGRRLAPREAPEPEAQTETAPRRARAPEPLKAKSSGEPRNTPEKSEKKEEGSDLMWVNP